MWINSLKNLNLSRFSWVEFITRLGGEFVILPSLTDTSHVRTLIPCYNPRPAVFSLKNSYKDLNVCIHHSLPLQWQRLKSLKPLLQTHRTPAKVLIQPCWQQDPSNSAQSTETLRTKTSQTIHLPREIIFSLLLCQSFRLSDFRPNVTLWVFSGCLLETRKPEISNRNTKWSQLWNWTHLSFSN